MRCLFTISWKTQKGEGKYDGSSRRRREYRIYINISAKTKENPVTDKECKITRKQKIIARFAN